MVKGLAIIGFIALLALAYYFVDGRRGNPMLDDVAVAAEESVKGVDDAVEETADDIDDAAEAAGKDDPNRSA